jgi:hypothetical protein
MPLYYLDFRDGNHISADVTGFDFEGLESARKEAFRSLAEIAKDAAREADRIELVLDVRDECRAHLLEVKLLLYATPK